MPRGVRETSEDALVALQDDTHNQVVAQSVMLRIETYVVEDDSDYESTPVVPPNDEYISEDELDEACTDSDSESDSIHAFIRATWQGNYWGSWASWNFVPPEKKDQWWHAFIQHYYWDDQFHDEIYLKWKKQTQVTVCGRISQNRRDNRQPSYMSDAHWATMVEKYNTEQAKRKSAKAARSRKSAPVGKKMHKHGAGPRCFLNIAYQMMVDEGLDEPPSYTALARKTHTGKDGSFLDERTEELVLEVEEAVEEMLQDGSPLGDSQTGSTAASNAKRYLLNQEYIKRGKTKKGTIYGLGSVQYKNSSPSVPIPVSLQRNLDVDMRMSGFETTISEVKEDIAGVKEDFSALKAEINAFKTQVTGGMSASQATLNIILQTLQSQASTPASTAQPSQPQAQSQPQGQPQAPIQSQHQPQAQGQSTALPQHLTINNPSELDRWCQDLGM
uniref:Transposase, Ptta/En/Spm, plant n=1 Tax=Brassica oleracea var. oleracea TaxID=109376 RepID=A0A0D3DS24_BRAOL